MKRIAIFASGSGSNAENIVNHFNRDKDVEVTLILSNKPDAFVHDRARRLQIPSYTYNNKDFDTGVLPLELLREYNIDFIVLAGFLLKVPQVLIDAFPNRIVNIHPALLPKYGGKGMYGDRVHRAVIDAREVESGITIHYVNENYDEGAIIFQAKCKIELGDTADTVAEKIHKLEYEHFPRVIEEICKK